MSTLDFIVRLIDAVAWPLVVTIAVIVLRRPIARLLAERPPQRVKLGPLDVEWTREIAEAQSELDAAGTPTTPSSGEPSLIGELEMEARRAPAVAVLEAYAVLERKLRALVEAHGASGNEMGRGAVGLARVAARKGLINEETSRAVQGVSVLRNLAAHGSARDVTQEQALDYLALVDGVLFTLADSPQIAAPSAGDRLTP